jgi:ankyrin repeat protein
MNENDWCILIRHACKKGDLEMLRRLMPRERAETLLGFHTPLERCCKYGQLKCVKWLVEEMCVSFGDSLQMAVRFDKYDCAKYLIDEGSNNCDIFCAVWKHNIPMIKLLLQMKQIIIPKDTLGQLVSCSLSKGDTYGVIARLLMDHGEQLEDGPQWALTYSKKCQIRRIACALIYYLRKNGIPKDLIRQIITFFSNLSKVGLE